MTRLLEPFEEQLVMVMVAGSQTAEEVTSL